MIRKLFDRPYLVYGLLALLLLGIVALLVRGCQKPEPPTPVPTRQHRYDTLHSTPSKAETRYQQHLDSLNQIKP